MKKDIIVEEKLNIPGNYQFKALNDSIFIKSNWHRNKLICISNSINVKNMRILDLGTGSGNFEIMFSNLANEIVGVDYNVEALKFLSNELENRSIRNVRLIKEDIRNIKKLVRV